MNKFALLTLLCLTFGVSQIQGFEFWDDLRVTWGTSTVGAFTRLPRNTVDAWDEGWIKVSETCENGGRFSGFQWIDPNDDGVSLLFDSNGFVAGIQAMAPQSELLIPESTFKYNMMPMYRNYTLNGKTYFAVTVYFIHPNLICSGGLGNGNIGANSSVFFQNGLTDNHLKVAPKNRADAISQGWTNNTCVPTMGRHNFFDVGNWDQHDCTEVQPTFLLYNKLDQLLGFGLRFAGNASSLRFERPKSFEVQAILGVAPQCILDQTDLIGITTVHFYFQDNPWLIDC